MVDIDFCKEKIESMLKRSQTKVIFPIISYGLLRDYVDKGQKIFSDSEIRLSYHGLPPRNDTSYNLIKGGVNGQKGIYTGTDHQQTPLG